MSLIDWFKRRFENNQGSLDANSTNESNPYIYSNIADETDETEIHAYISVFVAILVVLALIAMIVNVIVFSSVYWIRRPMSPILRMSISLAAADALSSTIFAVTLFINTYLPAIGISVKWLQLIMEMVKLSGILVTVSHLLALSLNHYIGILKPLHYNSIVTRRKVTAAILSLWIFPTAFVVFLFTSQADEDYWKENFFNGPTVSNRTTFMDTFRFRMSYSGFIIVSVLLMAICYTHILVVVRRQQKIWKGLSRVGSTKWSGRTLKNCAKTNKEQIKFEGSVRAVYTTLFILGSCIIGWLPAMLIFVLMCNNDCYIHGERLRKLIKDYLIESMCMRLLENMLVVLKMMANPIIYSIRMKEIQDGTKHMQSALIRIFCPSRPDSSNYILASRQSPNVCNSSLRTRLTTSINNGGHTSHVSIGRTEYVNTLL